MTTETQEQTQDAYSDLIDEAYIDPIRSVLIIDDEYPTWEDWLTGRVADSGTDQKWTDPNKIKTLIETFRSKQPALTVDIHNGKNEEKYLEDYIHQSDLLILDHALSPEDFAGEKALNISSTLLEETDHFNLILLHTNSDKLVEPFAQLLRSFLTPADKLLENQCSQGDDILDDFNNPEEIGDSISHQQYATFRKDSKNAINAACNGENPFNLFFEHCNSKNLDKKAKGALFMSLIKQYELKHKTEFRAEGQPDSLKWSATEPFWIRTNRGFIAFAKKSDSLDAVNFLKQALINWHPTPSRLLSARLRAEFESKGGIFEENFLSQKHVAWMFHNRLLTANTPEQESNFHAEIHRQMEHYTDAISNRLVDFGKNILLVVKSEPNSENRHSLSYGFDTLSTKEQNIALDHFNSFVSCKPRTGNHLAPGHIFTTKGIIWVVLTAACDLVPGRNKSKVHFDDDAQILPFTAARLFDKNQDGARKKATTTNYLFLSQDDSSVKAYGFFGSDDSDTEAPQSSCFFALNDGRFESDGELGLMLLSGVGDNIKSKTEKVQLHNQQLRYEYALSLMAKLGSHTTRVGLEFLSPKILNPN